jgi:chaperonin GroEL
VKALEAPIRQIAQNSGVEGSNVVGRMLDNSSQTYGFNAQTEEYEDMLQAGIVDPAKVVACLAVAEWVAAWAGWTSSSASSRATSAPWRFQEAGRASRPALFVSGGAGAFRSG